MGVFWLAGCLLRVGFAAASCWLGTARLGSEQKRQRRASQLALPLLSCLLLALPVRCSSSLPSRGAAGAASCFLIFLPHPSSLVPTMSILAVLSSSPPLHCTLERCWSLGGRLAASARSWPGHWCFFYHQPDTFCPELRMILVSQPRPSSWNKSHALSALVGHQTPTPREIARASGVVKRGGKGISKRGNGLRRRAAAWPFSTPCCFRCKPLQKIPEHTSAFATL